MKNQFNAALIFVILINGCSEPNQPAFLTSSVEANNITKQMIGIWGIDNQPSLIISLQNDQIVLSSPENEAWRINIQNAKIDGKSILFTQTHYLKNNETHPFNGVPCHSKISLAPNNKLKHSLSTKKFPNEETELLSKIEQ